MQAVNILRDECEFGKALLPARNLVMGSVRGQSVHEVAAVIKPFPDRREITFEHLGRRDDVERNSLPDGYVSATAKRRHPRLRRHTGARKHKEAPRFSKAPPQFR